MKLLSKLVDLVDKIPQCNREAIAFMWGGIFFSLCSTAFWFYIASLWFIPST